MKRVLIIPCFTFLLVCFVSVTFADVGVHKVSKKDSTSISELVHLDFAVATADEDGATPLAFGILNSDIAIPNGDISYICKKKLLYISPDVDTRWVWYNSLIANT